MLSISPEDIEDQQPELVDLTTNGAESAEKEVTPMITAKIKRERKKQDKVDKQQKFEAAAKD